jgi:hypothetical protein
MPNSPAHIKKIEKTVGWQSYMLGIHTGLLILNTVALWILWGEKGKPDWDHIAVSLTIFQTLFGIAALYGFWALRGLTQDKAEEVAHAVSSKLAQEIAASSAKDIAEQIANEIAARIAAEVAERIAKQEVREIAPPIIFREVKVAMETFREGGAISESALDRMVASIGGKEDGDGK